MKSQLYLSPTPGAKHGQASRANGKRPSREWLCWQNIIESCKPRNPRYRESNVLCDEWFWFEPFFEDMGVCPEGMQLNRHDYAKGFSKDNCYWGTRAQRYQGKNLRKTGIALK